MPLYTRIGTGSVLTAAQVKKLLPDTAWDFNILPPAEALEIWGLAEYTPAAPEPEPPAPTRQVPERVTARQGVAALIITVDPSGVSLYDRLLEVIANIADPVDRRLAQVDLDRSQDFERGSARVASWGPILGLTPAEMDDLFIYASTIPA